MVVTRTVGWLLNAMGMCSTESDQFLSVVQEEAQEQDIICHKSHGVTRHSNYNKVHVFTLTESRVQGCTLALYAVQDFTLNPQCLTWKSLRKKHFAFTVMLRVPVDVSYDNVSSRLSGTVLF